MNLSSLESRDRFALLGPGFGEGSMQLLTGLRMRGFTRPRDGQLEPTLVIAPYEGSGMEALCLGGELSPIPALEIDVPAPALSVTLDAERHAEGVERIRETIAQGDVYQVNFTLRARLAPVSGAGLFAALCKRGIPRFAAWIRLPGGREIVSASPELLFELHDGRVRAEPMKGTARIDQGEQLLRSEKDRAELAMITDLLRNDLTPVCTPRTVRVACERRFIELPYAFQAVSDVEGELLPEHGPLEVLHALHPGGSVTGAPKRAAMDLIRELETEPRGAYCGSLGLCAGSRAVFSLMIRTASREAGGGWVFGVGGGIVYDSDAGLELEEIRIKLGALG